MTNIVVLGAGVMGSALCIPAASNGHAVTLVGSPLDDPIIDSLLATGHHPTLDFDLPPAIKAVKNTDCSAETLVSADVIILGVSSPGVGWAVEKTRSAEAAPTLVSLVTKGLQPTPSHNGVPLTYVDTIPQSLDISADKLVGIGGPCIARELALGFPTRVVFGSTQLGAATTLREIFQTDYYRIKTTHDVVQLEACAALKNFLCIGVSAMLGAHTTENSSAKNPVAALFNQAVLELRTLSEWIARASESAGQQATQDNMAFDLAGMGDLHVTVGGGRNSRLGYYLGQGEAMDSILQNQLLNVTVEGVDTGKCIASAVQSACDEGTLHHKDLPLTLAVLASITTGAQFEFDMAQLPA